MKLNRTEILVIVLVAVIFLGTYAVSNSLAEQSGGSPNSGVDSIIMKTYNSLSDLGYGVETGDTSSTVWNRIISSALWVPNGTVTESDVVKGITFYNGSRTQRTGALDHPNYEAQSLAIKDFRDPNGADSWSSWTRTNASPVVWKDERTGLYWSEQQSASMTNQFTMATCNFFSTTSRGDYDGTDTDCGDAINLCGTLSLDANGDGLQDTTWYLPTQPELMQAYLDGIYQKTSTSWVTGNAFWSSTEYQNNSSNAWYTYLNAGFTLSNTKTTSYSVRCVLRDL